MVKITVEIPPAVKPEKAWVAGQTLIIDYHEWQVDLYNYIDKTKRIPFNELVGLEMVYGSRGGFHEMRLVHNFHTYEVFRLSKNHKGVITQIYKIARSIQLPTKKIVQKKGGE